MSKRIRKSKAWRQAVTDSEIDAVVEQVRRETARKYAGQLAPKVYAPRVRRARLPENGSQTG